MKIFIPYSLVISFILWIVPMSLMASYQLNDRNLEELIGAGPTGTIRASSGNADDTAMLQFKDKQIKIVWSTLSMDAQGKNDFGQRKLASGGGILMCPSLNFKGGFEDKCGFIGNPESDTLHIIGNRLSFNQTSLGFKSTATISAQEETPSIIRSLSFTKKAGTNFPLIVGQIDFSLKDNNFSGLGLPVFAISGIETLSLTFDKRKFN